MAQPIYDIFLEVLSRSQFPRTEVSGVSLPRMLIGTNWLLGYSHTGQAADRMIHSRHDIPENVAAVLDAYTQYGIGAIMAPNFAESTALRQGMHMAEEQTGKPFIQIVTPFINVDNSSAARKEAEAVIAQCAKDGATFCLIHHASAEQLVNKNKQTIDRLPDYLNMIRQHGMILGLSAHMPELIQYSDLNNYDAEHVALMIRKKQMLSASASLYRYYSKNSRLISTLPSMPGTLPVLVYCHISV